MMEETKEPTKKCKKCGREFPLSEFWQASTKDGHENTCKTCRKAMMVIADATRKAKRAAQKAAADKANDKPNPVLKIMDFTDTTLFAELKRRGYAGELKLVKKIVI